MRESLIERRVGDLFAVIRERHEVEEVLFVYVVCNSCDAKVMLSSDRPEAWPVQLSGWDVSEHRPYHDLCPECQ